MRLPRNIWTEVVALLGTVAVMWSRSLPAGAIAVLAVAVMSGYGFHSRGHTLAVFFPPSNGLPALKSASAAWSPTVGASALVAVALHGPTWAALVTVPAAAALTWLWEASCARWETAHVFAVTAGQPEPGELWWAWVPYADLLDGKVRPVKVETVAGSHAVVHKVTSTRPAPRRASQFVQMQLAAGRTSYMAKSTMRLQLGLLRDPMRGPRGRQSR